MRRAVIAVILTTLCVVGCGTVQADLHTNVKGPDEIEQITSIAATGMLATSLMQSSNSSALKSDGWKVSEKLENGAYTYSSSKTMKASEVTRGIGAPGQAQTPIEYSVLDSLFEREYRIKMRLASSPMPTPIPAASGSTKPSPEIDKAANQTAAQMFQMRWKVTTPGEIVQTNADNTDGKSATWNFATLESFTRGREMVLVSRERKNPLTSLPLLGGTIALAALVLAGGFVLLRMRGKAAATRPAD